MAARKPNAENTVATPVKEKDRAVAFVNWSVGSIRSSKGFALYDNQYTTAEEAALVALAKKHGGSVRVKAEFRIILHNDAPKTFDLDSIEVIED